MVSRLVMILSFVFALASCGKPHDAMRSVLPHPDQPGAVVEYFVEQPRSKGPWPTVIFLHGHQSPLNSRGGEVFASWKMLTRFANKGYLAVSISLPGYGRSSGSQDFAGPFTQHAVSAVIAKLEAERKAVPGKIVIEGISLGAVTAGLVAADDPDVAGLVLISGLYDLPAFFAQPKSPAAAAIKAVAIRQMGTAAGFPSRSLLLQIPSIRAHTLILNGAQDDRTDANQARQLAAIINTNGGRANAIIYPQYGHEIPVKARDLVISPFIDSVLKP